MCASSATYGVWPEHPFTELLEPAFCSLQACILIKAGMYETWSYLISWRNKLMLFDDRESRTSSCNMRRNNGYKQIIFKKKIKLTWGCLSHNRWEWPLPSSEMLRRLGTTAGPPETCVDPIPVPGETYPLDFKSYKIKKLNI